MLANIPVIPIIMGFILGPQIEDRFIKSMLMSNGDLSILLHSYVAQATFLLIFIGYVCNYFLKKNY